MADALRFACQPGCTKCCEQKGVVYLTDADIERAARFLAITPAEFEARYVYRTRHQMRLRVPRQKQCHFLIAGGCSIHPAKPAQCSAFPYWPELLESRREWNRTAQYCPGMGQGPLVEIEAAWTVARELESVSRKPKK